MQHMPANTNIHFDRPARKAAACRIPPFDSPLRRGGACFRHLVREVQRRDSSHRKYGAHERITSQLWVRIQLKVVCLSEISEAQISRIT
jgi:hypothetical protein